MLLKNKNYILLRMVSKQKTRCLTINSYKRYLIFLIDITDVIIILKCIFKSSFELEKH